MFVWTTGKKTEIMNCLKEPNFVSIQRFGLKLFVFILEVEESIQESTLR